MYKTLIINAGSSSIKWALYKLYSEKIFAYGIVERIGLKKSKIKININNKYYIYILDIFNHKIALDIIFKKIFYLNIIKSFDEIYCVGHRVVAGGEYFKKSVFIDNYVISKIEMLFELAPLHNPINLLCIKILKKKLLKNTFHIAIFDSSFYVNIPKYNFLYGIPFEYYEKYKIRKYGAHGISHRYIFQRLLEISNKFLYNKIIICHLGNGSSITAIKNGKVLDTSMGFTPLTGLLMGTRSGDIDVSIIPYLMKKLSIFNIKKIIEILNKKSGLLGISGISSDMRDLEKNKDNIRVKLAYNIFINRICKYIGSYIADMNGIDVLVFTAGIGENDFELRKKIINNLSFFGFKIDIEKNKILSKECKISNENSKIDIWLIPTNEELMMVKDINKLFLKKKNN